MDNRERSGVTMRLVALTGAIAHIATGLLGLAYLALLSWLDNDEQLHKRVNQGMAPSGVDPRPPA